jgi:quercetin dioxygenase-like cupin family protein
MKAQLPLPAATAEPLRRRACLPSSTPAWLPAVRPNSSSHGKFLEGRTLMSVKHTADVEANAVAAGKGTTIQVLISAQEGGNFAMRKFAMQPGGGMPLHTNSVEHEQYVLSGHGKVGIDGKVFEVEPGDVVLIPEGVPHWYENAGQDAFEFLCIIPNKKDVITLLDDNSH